MENPTTYFYNFLDIFCNYLSKLESKFSNRSMAITYMFISCFLFTTLNALTKLSTEIPTFQLTYIRGIFEMSLSIIALSHSNGVIFTKDRQTNKLLTVRGMLGGLNLVMYIYALYHIPISISTALFMMTPLWIGIVTCIKDKELNHWNFIFMVISFIAMLLIIKPGDSKKKNEEYDENAMNKQYISFFLALLVGMFAGVIYFTIKNLQGKIHLAAIVFYLNMFCTIYSGIAQIYQGTIKLTPYHFFMIFLMSLAGWSGQMFRSRALILDKVFLMSILLYSQIVISYFADIFVLGIDLDLYSVLGSFLIGISMTGLIIMDKKKFKYILYNKICLFFIALINSITNF